MPDRHATRLAARVAACLLLLVAAANAAEPPRTLDRIRADGIIRIGYRSGAAPFSFKERDGSVRGYSVEICTRVAASIQKRLGLTSLKVEWTPLDAGNRLEAVAKGRVDIECGTTTISLSRYETVDFSLPIFVDGGSVLTAVDSKLQRFTDLNSRRIAVIPGTTTESAFLRQLAVNGIEAQLVPVKDSSEGIALLHAGQGRRLRQRSHRARGTARAERRSDALATSRQRFFLRAVCAGRAPRRPRFPLAVNRALVDLYGSGDIDAIFYRWLAGLGRPGPLLNAMFYLSTLPQ